MPESEHRPAPASPAIESPPPVPQPAREAGKDPREALNRLAFELARTRDRRLLVEFLSLRRAVR